jgi:hypothetical protein
MPRLGKSVRRWKPAFVGIEAIAANNAVYKLAVRYTDPIIPAAAMNKGDRDKLVHATAGITLAASGRIVLPADGVDASFPTEVVLTQLTRFTGDEKKDANDDIVDTLSYAAEYMLDPPPPGGAKAGLPRVMGGP